MKKLRAMTKIIFLLVGVGLLSPALTSAQELPPEAGPPPPPSTPLPSPPPPPPISLPLFSQPITSLFPNQPFVTCLQGHFEQPISPHFWFIKAKATGNLTIDVRAVAVNPEEESGSITARLFDGSNLLGQVTVAHPTDGIPTGADYQAGAERIGFIDAFVTSSIPPAPPKIYRLEVTRSIPIITTTREAHHYKLSFSGVPVDVGVNSPTYRLFEPGPQVFHVNVGSEGNLKLAILADSPDLGAPQATVATVGIVGLFGPAVQPVPSVVDLTGVPPGAYAVSIIANEHYRLDKQSGTDRGTYFASDTCPPCQPPTVGPITATLDPVPVNTNINASASFTDPVVLDIHESVWNWGDGSTSPGVVVDTNNGSGSVSGNHTYTAAGVYTLNLTVSAKTKKCGPGQSFFQYVVVYDPGAGFVTGGGWINSPAGAYTPDPNLTGRANFGFVSKYLKGAATPTGQTEFNFRVADMNFHSTDYEWLVVSGPKAQYKGSGTINRSGNYGFILTAIDGQITGGGGVDKFRIKIVDKATGNLVYDNQMGATDDTDPATAIAAGSIVIHKSDAAPPLTTYLPNLLPTSALSPKVTSLGAAFPNPFNPETWIPFSLAKDVKVTIRLYNVSGTLIRILDLGQKQAGFYTTKDRSAYWDGRNHYGELVSSGIYFYNIQAGEYTATRKMLLLK